MVVIEKAVLHVLDIDAAAAVYSDSLLPLEDGAKDFLIKHIEKTMNSQEAKNGVFYEDSVFQSQLMEYKRGNIDFISLSADTAKRLQTMLSQSAELKPADFIMCQVRIEDRSLLVIFKCNSHQGFVHQIYQTETGFGTQLANHYAILPGMTQKIDEFAYIDLEKLDIKVKSRKYTIDGSSVLLLPELLLECAPAPSPAETIKKVQQVVRKVAEDFGQDQVAAAAAVKTFIAENAEKMSAIDPNEAGKEVFRDSISMQEAYSKELNSKGPVEPVKVDKEATLKKMSRHKLSTDTGIELTIPTDYFENTEYIEFSQNDDGSYSITLKHIQNIINKS